MEKFDPKNLKPTDYTEEEKVLMRNLVEKMNNQPLTNDEYRYLQYYLMKYEFLYQSNYSKFPPYPLCKMGVTGNKIMFISDTHRGNSAIENKHFIDIAYNEALKQNIKAVVHAGDFIEAGPVDHDKKFEVVLKELDAAINDLPNEITTGLLLGNHDYSAIRTYPKIIPSYFNIPKIEILGMQKVLLNWDGLAFIRINHPISQLKEPKEEDKSQIITLEGHHHFYDYFEDLHTIHLPSLSMYTTQVFNDSLSSKGLRYHSLFVIAEKQGDTLQFHNYCIDRSFKGQLLVTDIVEVNTKTKQLKWHK